MWDVCLAKYQVRNWKACLHLFFISVTGPPDIVINNCLRRWRKHLFFSFIASLQIFRKHSETFIPCCYVCSISDVLRSILRIFFSSLIFAGINVSFKDWPSWCFAQWLHQSWDSGAKFFDLKIFVLCFVKFLLFIPRAYTFSTKICFWCYFSHCMPLMSRG